MKRFLSLLTVFVLAFSLAVPVGASNDMWLYNEHEYPAPPDYDTEIYPYSAISVYYGTVYFHCNSKRGVVDNNKLQYSDSISVGYKLQNGVWIEDYRRDTPTVYSSNFKDNVYQWSNYDIVNSDGSIYLEGTLAFNPNGVCDGSSCPATDVNIDGICDDCGMALMSLSRSPVAPDVTGNNKNYVMFYSGTVYQYTAYTSNSSYTIRGEEYGARYRTYLEPSATATRFQSYDGINWEQTYNGTTANDYPGEIGWDLISSTYDWYTEEGDRFFPVPLWEEVQTVTQGEMGILTSETAGTMRTLVVCGVGLMACLMALSLFGKRWLLFLR